MPSPRQGTPYDEFRAAAVAVAGSRPEVDQELAVELMLEAATMLDDGLALDGLDEHDTAATVAALCFDLVAADPAEAVRTRAAGVREHGVELHDPEAVSASLLVAAAVLQL